MTLEEEFDAIYEYDPEAICDLLNATGQDQKVFYKDPLYDLYNGIDTDAKGAHELLRIFNSTSEIKFNINDIGNNTTTFLTYVSDGMSNSNRFRDYCKIAFVKAMQKVPDRSIERWYDGNESDYAAIDFGGDKLTDVPSYLRKYITLTVPNITFQSCNKLTHVDISDIVDYRKIFFNNCNSLVSVKAFTCSKIHISGDVFSKLEVIENPYGFGEENVIEINVQTTAITSLEDIVIEPAFGCYYRMYIPSRITSFENPAYPENMYIHYYLGPRSQMTSFFGLKRNQTLFFLLFTSAVMLSDIMHDEKLMKTYLPNISNLPYKYRGYVQILDAYPELLTDKLLATIYKGYEPYSLAKFELLIKKFKSYNVDMDKIGLLTSLLLK